MIARVDPRIAAELTRCPLKWSLQQAKRHVLVRVAGKVVSKIPYGHPSEAGRAALNVRAAIRRRVKEIGP